MPNRVFISYSQESEAHKQRVHALADRLRAEGIGIILDRDCGPGGPDEGWDTWSGRQAEIAEVVILVFTPVYRRCWDGEQPQSVRQGATHETKVLYRRLYEAGAEVDFCRVLTFEDDHKNCIPKFIAGLHTFDANRDYADIVAWLRKLGAAPPLPTSNMPINWPNPIVNYPWPLADRKEPFELFQDIITARRRERIFLVDGPSSSGKTVLLTELFKYANNLGLRAVQLELKGCPTLDELFEMLALEVDAAILPAFHSASGYPRKNALLKDLEKLRSPLVLGFDTYQAVPADIADWIEGQLLRRVGQCPGLVVTLSGQKVPDHTRFPWAGLAVPVTLPPIKEAGHWVVYAQNALGNPAITEAHIEMLLHIYQGEPGQTSASLRSFNPSIS
ncbi:MAG: SEFIR domain-containing protein [Candidatus Methylumidiphilus sp.]